MVRQEIKFNELQGRIIEFLDGKRAIVLATSVDNRVTARTVSYVNDHLQIFFWSYENHTKCQQIQINSTVALCRDNLQVEGKAEMRGSILDIQNESYLDRYKEKYPKEYERWLNKPNMVLVTVHPTLFVIMVSIDGKLYRDHLDLINKQAFRIEFAD